MRALNPGHLAVQHHSERIFGKPVGYSSWRAGDGVDRFVLPSISPILNEENSSIVGTI